MVGVRVKLAAVLALAASLLLGAVGAAQAQDACKPVRKACIDAGFKPGAARAGTGLQRDCLEPLVSGQSQPRNATLPLPQVPASVLSACRQVDGPAGTRIPAMTRPAPPPAPRPGHWPNIVMILVDDYSLNLMAQSMPNLAALQGDGVTFDNYYVTDSLCCPSRSSIFTGKLPHDTQVFTNTPPLGGFGAFMAHDDVSHTFALALHAAGYRTAMMGKYLNGYDPAKDGPSPGWSEWDVAGNGYPEFNYALNENGQLNHYGTDQAAYLTDVLSDRADAFIRGAAGKPFFIEIATFAPHAPYTPAPRDADRFPGLAYSRAAPFLARPNATAPEWLKIMPPLGPNILAKIDHDFRLRVQADQAVDKLLGRLRATLAELGLDRDTYVIFTSDNGYHMGEYSLRPGKMTPFDTDIRVPLVVAGPNVTRGQVRNEFVENIDLAPTYAELAGAGAPLEPDGRSLAPLLHAAPGADGAIPWRRSVLVEHRHPGEDASDPDLQERASGNPPSYEALRADGVLYVEYDDAAKEVSYYDLRRDPLELNNIAGSMPASTLARWHTILSHNAACHGAAACWAAQSEAP
jgi:arylsulfatase A-like enzyme